MSPGNGGPSQPSNRRVLIVADDPATLALTERCLAEAGNAVRQVRTVASALRLIVTQSPSVVIADSVSPQADGLEVCRAIRSHDQAGSVYVIVLGTDPSTERMRAALDARADDYLVKPFAEHELLARVRAGERIAELHRKLEQRDREDRFFNKERAMVNQRLNRMGGIASFAGPTDGREDAARVLLVDDDPAVRKLCRRVLELNGYRVREASDGVDALAKIDDEPPEAIVMDAAMPNMDGLECTRRLKADPTTCEIPIIMASAHTSEEDVVQGLDAGVDEYLAKPIRLKEFTVRVRSMVRLHRSKAELLHSNAVRGEQARALNVLLDLSRDLSTADSLEAILERTVAATSELTVSRRVSIMLPDAEDRYLTIAKAVGLDAEVAARVRVPVGAATAGQVYRTGQPILVNRPGDRHRSARQYDSEFFVSVPLISKPLIGAESVVGVLNITERQGGAPFTPQEVEYIDMVCNLAAAAIEETGTRQSRDEARDSIVTALATLAEYRDNDTGRHLERVTRFALLLAEQLRQTEPFENEIDADFLCDLRRAVPLHDIGKVGVPDSILLKPGQLTAEEMAIIRRHPAIGAETIHSVISRAPGARCLRMAEQIAWAHHEWYDGSGYPRQLAGPAIPTAARLAALADVYDALTTKRPYKEALSHAEAAALIRSESGTHFDPAIVEAFSALEDDFARLAAELADAHQTAGKPAAQRPGPTAPALALT